MRIGTAGWSIPAQYAAAFAQVGTHLERYARRLGAVEINSSFYRPHLPKTYQRWAETVPEDFRFAVKMPREITHTRRLVGVEQPLAQFVSEVGMLGAKLGPLLVQLPPSLSFREKTADAFFRQFRSRFDGLIACEPRHATWFTDEVDALLSRFQVARVAADPACVPRAAAPGGWPGLVYYRLHGFPEVYHSAYGAEYVANLGKSTARHAADAEAWCIFDNTARGEAANDALCSNGGHRGLPRRRISLRPMAMAPRVSALADAASHLADCSAPAARQQGSQAPDDPRGSGSQPVASVTVAPRREGSNRSKRGCCPRCGPEPGDMQRQVGAVRRNDGASRLSSVVRV